MKPIGQNIFNLTYDFKTANYVALKFQMIKENALENSTFIDDLFAEYLAQNVPVTHEIPKVQKSIISMCFANYLNTIEDLNVRLDLLIKMFLHEKKFVQTHSLTLLQLLSFHIREMPVKYSDLEECLLMLESEDIIPNIHFDLEDLLLLEDSRFRNVDLYLRLSNKELEQSKQKNFAFKRTINIYNSNARKLGLSETLSNNIQYLCSRLEKQSSTKKYVIQLHLAQKLTYFTLQNNIKVYDSIYYPQQKVLSAQKGLLKLLNSSKKIKLFRFEKNSGVKFARCKKKDIERSIEYLVVDFETYKHLFVYSSRFGIEDTSSPYINTDYVEHVDFLKENLDARMFSILGYVKK